MPAAAAVALGLGALFSTGIVFVREVLNASDAEFGWLIALFGAGAVLASPRSSARRAGMRYSAPRSDARDRGRRRRVQPVAGSVGGVPRRGRLRRRRRLHARCGMGLLQSQLDGQERVSRSPRSTS